MMGHLLGIFTFLLGMLLALTLGYGYYHKNKYIQIYSICAIAWIGFIYFGTQEIFGVVLLRFHELLNLICIILPLIPLWFFYKFSPSEREARAKEEQEYRDRMGIGKTPEEHMEYLIKKGIINPNPKPQPIPEPKPVATLPEPDEQIEKICRHCGSDKDVEWRNGEYVCDECWDILSEFAGE